MPDRPRLSRLLAAGLAAVLVVVVLAAPASAHVTAHAFEARPGGTDAGVTVRVPNEKDNASTVTVALALPLDTPLIGVLVRPLAGWTSTVARAKLPTPVKTDDGTITEAVRLVTWRGGKIGPGQYEDFQLDVAQLPDARQVVLKVLQTYSDGEVVRWIGTQTAGQPAPEHPAAILSLAGSTQPATPAANPTGTAGSASRSSVRVATGLAAAGLLLAAAAGLLGGLALRRARVNRS